MNRRSQKKLVGIILGLMILLAGYFADQNPELSTKFFGTPPSGTYKVVKFDDGDTIAVDMNGKQETIRFIGVDTPETHDPRKVVQCFGHSASAYTKQLIGGEPVRLELDPLSSNRDRYNRLLRYVYLPNGTLVNSEIIKQGYGFAIASFPFTKSDEFLALQKEAREQNRGLWQECTPTTNQYGGFTSNPAD